MTPANWQNLTIFNGHIKTGNQRTIIEQYGDWYTARPLFAVPKTSRPSTVSVPTSYYVMWRMCTLRVKRNW